MNLANMQKLIDALKATETFDMSLWGLGKGFGDNNRRVFADSVEYCETPGCIAGHAAMLAKQENPKIVGLILPIAIDWLGIERWFALQLFSSISYWDEIAGCVHPALRHIRKNVVIKHLQDLLEAEKGK